MRRIKVFGKQQKHESNHQLARAGDEATVENSGEDEVIYPWMGKNSKRGPGFLIKKRRRKRTDSLGPGKLSDQTVTSKKGEEKGPENLRREKQERENSAGWRVQIL